MRPLLVLLAGLAALLCVAGALVASAYRRDMAREYQRIQARGQVIASPFGDIEYLEGGRAGGLAVLVVHGSGGGWDQGELLARAALGEGTAQRWIAPSRFGYLRSTFRPGASFDAEFAARHIADARLVAFERGGHLLLAVEQPAVQRLVVEHITRSSGATPKR